jgi:DNA-binding NarL/FixJ family response regulator
MEEQNKISIIIVDDHPLTRAGFATLVKEDDTLELVAEAAQGLEGLDKIKAHKPDIAVIDIDLPMINGLELSKLTKVESPKTEVIILTGYPDESYFAEAMKLGVSGYILKDETEDLVDAIKKVYSGENYLSPKVHEMLIRLYKKRSQLAENKPNLKSLTEREMEILRLISENKSNNEIANELYIEIRTVETHRNNIREKLNLKGGGKNALLLFALQNKELLY